MEKRTTKTDSVAQRVEKVIKEIERGESMRRACEKVKIQKSVFMRWVKEKEDVRDRYARACEERQSILFDEIIEIADNVQEGKTIKETTDSKNGRSREVVIGDMIQHRRLQIEARKWALAKMNPKKYGDKVDLTTDGEKLVNITLDLGDVNE